MTQLELRAAALCALISGLGPAPHTAEANRAVVRPQVRSEEPTVLFDEGHFNYHTTTTRYDTLVALLAHEGFDVIAHTGGFTREALAGYDILTIVNAQPASEWNEANSFDAAFTPTEVEVVASWVEAGGALLLVADHVPWSGAAASMAAAFGVDMKNGITGDTVHSPNPSRTNPPGAAITFTRSNGLLGGHPILDGRDPAERINRLELGGGPIARVAQRKLPVAVAGTLSVRLGFYA